MRNSLRFRSTHQVSTLREALTQALTQLSEERRAQRALGPRFGALEVRIGSRTSRVRTPLR